MTGVATPLNFGRKHIDSIMAGNGLGEFVGMTPVIVDGLDCNGRDIREHLGWFLTGTDGYAEVDAAGGVCRVGVWLPSGVIGE